MFNSFPALLRMSDFTLQIKEDVPIKSQFGVWSLSSPKALDKPKTCKRPAAIWQRFLKASLLPTRGKQNAE